MEVGILRLEEPGVFRPLLLPETADALAAGEPVTALALTDHELAVGAAAGCLEGDRFRICSLFVAPEYRRLGGGTMLVEQLCRLSASYAGAVECSFTVTRPEHRALPPFLTARGFREVTDESGAIRLTTLGEAAASPFFSREGGEVGTPLFQLSPAALSLAEKAALAEGAPLPEGGLSADGIDREVSLVLLQGSEPRALLLLDRSFPCALTVAAAWSDRRYPAAFPALLRSAMNRAKARYPMDTPLALQTVGGASAVLARTLLPTAAPVSHTYIRPTR